MKIGNKIIIAMACGAMFCNCTQAGHQSTKINQGSCVGNWPATDKLQDFFFDEQGKAFFPIGKWLVNFSYDTQNKKLDLVHLNALVSKNAKCNIYVNNDTINIKETGSEKSAVTPKDVVYSLNNVEPRNYTLLVNGKKVELDLRDINAKWNYSLLENGSVMIAMYDQVADADEK